MSDQQPTGGAAMPDGLPTRAAPNALAEDVEWMVAIYVVTIVLTALFRVLYVVIRALVIATGRAIVWAHGRVVAWYAARQAGRP